VTFRHNQQIETRDAGRVTAKEQHVHKVNRICAYGWMLIAGDGGSSVGGGAAWRPRQRGANRVATLEHLMNMDAAADQDGFAARNSE
jgi:hypothetical protein